MSTPPNVSALRHWLGFLFSGGTAFVVDSTLLKLLTVVLGWPVLPARVVSISVAMIAGWLGHRTFTFAVKTRPTVREYVKYLGVAWSVAAINYAVFAIVMFVRPTIEPVLAIVIASAVAMVASYLGLRFGAFRPPAEPAD